MESIESARWVTAEDFLKKVLESSRLPSELLNEIIWSTLPQIPLDFPVRISRHLPFLLDRMNMIGVTLLGRVWLRADLLERPTLSIVATLIHEAVHVAQQRRNPVRFYLRYVGGWALNALNPIPGRALRTARIRRGWLHAAYRFLPEERIAYTTEARFRARTLRSLRQAGLPIDLF